MATPNVGILTNAGKNLIDQVNAGQTKITFSKIVFSSMDNNQLTDDQIKALTTVAPQEIVVNNPEVTLDNNTGETRIRATGNNEALTDGVYVKTYAVYAKDDSSNEILYGITVSPNPNYLPEYDGVTPQAVTYSYKVNISNTSNITFTNSNDVYVSDTDLAEALQPYAKTVDVNQQLDKKVNIADMRKPASDVAGIEEVNVKADASAIDQLKTDVTSQVSTLQTQVDNSAVGTNLAIGTNQEYAMGYGIPTTTWEDGYAYEKLPTTIYMDEILPQDSHSFGYTLAQGVTYTQTIWVETDATVKDLSAAQITWYTQAGHDFQPAIVQKLGQNSYKVVSTYAWPGKSDNNVRLFDIEKLDSAFDLSTGTYLKFGKLKLEKGSVATDWCPNPEDKVNVSDMRKPASDVAGIDEVNTKQDKIGYTPANDSKVAHLSGANNFDTVPTVNNNSLLLASSLPSDLARTGSDQEFTGKNTFDTAPIDKTTGNPYITKDGVPSDVARTSQQTNFTAGLQSGGVSVATSDDLKSVENSAWHQLSMPDCDGMRGITLLYRNFISDHYMNLYAYGTAIPSSIKGPTMLDLSSLVDNIESVSGMARDLTVRMSSSIFRDSSGGETLVDLVASGNKLTLGTNVTIFTGGPVQINGHDSPFAKVNYDNWIGS